MGHTLLSHTYEYKDLLSHILWAERELNPRPTPYKSAALTTELPAPDGAVISEGKNGTTHAFEPQSGLGR